MHFQEVFCRYLWNGPSTLKIEEEKNIFKTIIPSNFPVEHWLWDTTLQKKNWDLTRQQELPFII